MNQAIKRSIFNRITAVTLVIALTAAIACSGAAPTREESKNKGRIQDNERIQGDARPTPAGPTIRPDFPKR